jgi:hypothetical protein
LKELPVLNTAQRMRETNKQTKAVAGSRLGLTSWVAGETVKTGGRGGKEQMNQEARDRQMKSAYCTVSELLETCGERLGGRPDPLA